MFPLSPCPRLLDRLYLHYFLFLPIRLRCLVSSSRRVPSSLPLTLYSPQQTRLKRYLSAQLAQVSHHTKRSAHHVDVAQERSFVHIVVPRKSDEPHLVGFCCPPSATALDGRGMTMGAEQAVAAAPMPTSDPVGSANGLVPG